MNWNEREESTTPTLQIPAAAASFLAVLPVMLQAQLRGCLPELMKGARIKGQCVVAGSQTQPIRIPLPIDRQVVERVRLFLIALQERQAPAGEPADGMYHGSKLRNELYSRMTERLLRPAEQAYRRQGGKGCLFPEQEFVRELGRFLASQRHRRTSANT